MRIVEFLALLLIAGTLSIVSATDATVSTTCSNATVLADPALEVQLTTGDEGLPVDALLKIRLDALFAVSSDAAVNDTALQEALNGHWSVTVDTDTNVLAVQRSGDGSVVSSGVLLRFKLTGVTNPTRAGRISTGSTEISNPGATFSRILQLPSMEVEPGAIWNSKLTFSNLLSGRTTSLEIHSTLAHAVPNDGAVGVYLSYMYGSLSGVTLSSVVGLDGDFTISTQNNVIWIKRTAMSGTDSGEMQGVTIRIDGILHPLLEGPMGPSVLVQTVDGSSCIIDQAYVDTSGNILAKARVVVNKLSLRVIEGDATGGQYTFSLTAPPFGDTELTVAVGDSVSRTKLTLDPQSVVFTTSNWSSPAAITVIVADDYMVSGTSTEESVVAVPHSITSGDSGRTFAVADEVSVHISENDFPAVHISDRFLAVIEGLRNDSYEISLLSQPSNDVVVHLAPHDPFIETFPDQVTFTAIHAVTPPLRGLLHAY
ncbi:hypothetical protein KRP22_001498 [Phytophthora ramorum]|nr:hypothetical protein KRP22_7093 [Phytophthora ramorum]